ncbi:MAG: hypothetical protein PVI86_15805 [Phycisphaerae bacterium]|jgi:hypothetical protein
MRHKLVSHVIGAAAALATVTVAARADADRKHARTDRRGPGAVLTVKSGHAAIALANAQHARPTPLGRVATGKSTALPAGLSCQNPDSEAAITSDRESGYLVAEDFTPAASGTITQVTWRGAYWDFDSLPERECVTIPTDLFEIAYYADADADGVPDDVPVARFRASNGSLTLTQRVDTGASIADRATEYEYSATHAPFDVQQDTCYWIEITNAVTACSWLWEASVDGNGRSFQAGDGITSPTGYDRADLSSDDLTFCVDVLLGEPTACTPDAPSNDTWQQAATLPGDGEFDFDSFSATMTGPSHAACMASGHTEVDHDLWYYWTANCDATAVVWTCFKDTTVDTKIAVYNGCQGCAPSDATILACNDDRCDLEAVPRQSLATFRAVANQRYLIRLGTYPGSPGGPGQFEIRCPATDAQPNCPGSTDCCDPDTTDTPGCSDGSCCNLVCLCDPFCCEDAWVSECSIGGYRGYGCSADQLCLDSCAICGNPEADGCCCASTRPGCSDAVCCEAVCDADQFCCEVEWDENCATDGFGDPPSGNGAAVLCPGLCRGERHCPDGPVTLINPPDGTIDARQPHTPSSADQPQGIDTIELFAPEGADDSLCWGLCHTGGTDEGVTVTSVQSDGGGRFTVHLSGPIPTAAATDLVYHGCAGSRTVGTVTAHPGNVNGDGEANPTDIETLIECCLNRQCEPPLSPTEAVYRCDINRSGAITPADLLREIDILNGADPYAPWLNTPLPGPAVCP